MVVRKEDSTAKVHLSEISSVILQSQQVFLSAYLLAELAKNKVSLVVSDEAQNPIGQYLPLYGAHNTSGRVAEQINWGEPVKKRVWQHVVKDKLFQQATFLDERGYSEAKLVYAAVPEVRSGDATNREAQGARIYFAALFGADFNRNFDCAENAALNYGYAILLSMVNREIVSRGYLTQCGICHRNEYNQFNLACDLMEPFRPAVDRLVVDCLDGGFDKELKRQLAGLANRGIVYRGGTYRLASVVSLYVQDCLNALGKRIPVDDIEPFRII